jgi:hypothetical protein
MSSRLQVAAEKPSLIDVRITRAMRRDRVF